MKRIVTLLGIGLLLSLFLSPIPARAKEKVNIYFFHGAECPHCAEMKEYLTTVETRYDNVTIYPYEVWHSPENAKLLEESAELLNVTIRGVPFTIVGDQVFQGYNRSVDKRVDQAIEELSQKGYNDRVGKLLKIVEGDPYEKTEEEPPAKEDPPEETPSIDIDQSQERKTVRLPFFGEISQTGLVMTLMGLGIMIAMTIIYFVTKKKKRAEI